MKDGGKKVVLKAHEIEATSCGKASNGEMITSCGHANKGKEATSCGLSNQKEGIVSKLVPPRYWPPIPFSQRLTNMESLKAKCKFNALIRKLHLDTPFLHALGGIPRYASHFKKLLKHKKVLKDMIKAYLTEECSTILDKGYPRKVGDPEAFVVPCMVKDLDFDNAMADLGASVSIMPSFVYDRLILPPLTPTHLTIYPVDRSIWYPKGIVEDVLVRIKDCIILVDFVLLDVGNEDLNWHTRDSWKVILS